MHIGTELMYLLSNSSTIIAHLDGYCKAPEYALAYYYFNVDLKNFKVSKGSDIEIFLRSLIFQLIKQCPKTPTDALEKLYPQAQMLADVDALFLVLSQLLAQFKETFLVIDAVDQSVDASRAAQLVKRIATSKIPGLHILLQSGSSTIVQNALREVITTHWVFDGNDFAADISLYIRTRLDHDTSKWKD